MKHKDLIGEAAESMREPWELFVSEVRNGTPSTPPQQWGQLRWERESIAFVSRLMPDEKVGIILAVARRLREG